MRLERVRAFAVGLLLLTLCAAIVAAVATLTVAQFVQW